MLFWTALLPAGCDRKGGLMNQVQEWFEKLVGVPSGVGRRRQMAESLFRRPSFDAAAFQTPACWRRKTACRLRNPERTDR